MDRKKRRKRRIKFTEYEHLEIQDPLEALGIGSMTNLKTKFKTDYEGSLVFGDDQTLNELKFKEGEIPKRGRGYVSTVKKPAKPKQTIFINPEIKRTDKTRNTIKSNRFGNDQSIPDLFGMGKPTTTKKSTSPKTAKPKTKTTKAKTTRQKTAKRKTAKPKNTTKKQPSKRPANTNKFIF